MTSGTWAGFGVDVPAADPERAVEQANRELVLQYLVRVWRDGDLEWAESAVARDHRMNRPDGSVLYGFESWRASVRRLRAAFEGIRFDIRHVIAEGDVVAVHSTLHGVHVGEFLGHAGTGRPVSAHHADFYRVGDGRLVEHWDVTDVLGILRQIGVRNSPD